MLGPGGMLDRRACVVGVHDSGRRSASGIPPATSLGAGTPNPGYPVPPRHPYQDLPRFSAGTCRPEGALYTPHPGRETDGETIQAIAKIAGVAQW